MKIKYRILWFEDDEDVIYDDPGPSIRSFLLDLGFQVEIIHKLNGENLNNLIKDRNFDLIVTDLNLGEHETGEQLIDHIREGNILTEVLLYSANANEINNIVGRKGWIERASFCVGIGNLKNKLKEIISLTVRKNQDVNNIRGLVIAETIDLEIKIEKILMSYFQAAEDQILNDRKTELLRHIHSKKIEKHLADLEFIKSVKFTEIKRLIEDDILTASNSFDAIHSILNDNLKDINTKLNLSKIQSDVKLVLQNKKDEITKIKTELNGFRTEILKIRNTLAHVKEEIGEDGVPFLSSLSSDGSTIKFDNLKYIEIRKNLIKHNVNLDKIIVHINPT